MRRGDFVMALPMFWCDAPGAFGIGSITTYTVHRRPQAVYRKLSEGGGGISFSTFGVDLGVLSISSKSAYSSSARV